MGGRDGLDRPKQPAARTASLQIGPGHEGLDHVPLAVGDQADVDAELPAEHHEQPAAFGPESLGLRGHAPQEHVVGAGDHLGELFRAEAAGLNELDLLDDPVEDPADACQIVSRASHPAGDGRVKHAVLEMAGIGSRAPLRFLQLREQLWRQLVGQERTRGGIDLVLRAWGALEELVELLGRHPEVVAARAEGRSLDQLDRAGENRRLVGRVAPHRPGLRRRRGFRRRNGPGRYVPACVRSSVLSFE